MPRKKKIEEETLSAPEPVPDVLPPEPEEAVHEERIARQKPRRRLKARRAVALLVLAACVIGGLLYYRSYTSPEAEAARLEAKNRQLIETVGKRMLLPAGETPVIYQIDDPALLIAEQPFFVGSEKGDRLLIYPQSARAIIWSPSRKRIVNAGPLDLTAPEEAR